MATNDATSGDEPKYRNEEWLRIQYVEKELSQREIANLCGCSRQPIKTMLKSHNIKTRSPGGVSNVDERLKNENWVRQKYHKEHKTTREIADICGCSCHAVHNWLKRHGIETRSRTPAADKRLRKKQWLYEQYIEKQKSTSQIADICGCYRSTVGQWLKRHNIKTRPKAPSGSENPNWNGGKKPYGDGWNEQKRQTIRSRDGHTCKDPNCSTTQKKHIKKYDEKLHVHHLRKARDVDDPEERNAKENLITLCRDCHYQWEQMSDAGIVPQIEHVAD